MTTNVLITFCLLLICCATSEEKKARNIGRRTYEYVGCFKPRKCYPKIYHQVPVNKQQWRARNLTYLVDECAYHIPENKTSFSVVRISTTIRCKTNNDNPKKRKRQNCNKTSEKCWPSDPQNDECVVGRRPADAVYKTFECGLRRTPLLSKRILYGYQAEHWPWMAGIFSMTWYNEGAYPVFCAASLISSKWLVTATHCILLEGMCESCGNTTLIEERLQIFKGFIKQGIMKIGVGYSDVADMAGNIGDLKAIKDVYIMRDKHNNPLFGKGYPPLRHDYDIALIELEEHLDLDPERVWPICVDDGQFNVGDECTTIGWGYTEKGGNETKLQELKIPIQDPKVCKDWNLHLSDRLLCVGPASPDGNVCWGDSGGPLQCSQQVGNETVWYLTGVVSTGNYTCPSGAPALYGNIANFEIRNWIKDMTGI